jgi:succinyl-diaminopimelate desuccinylase
VNRSNYPSEISDTVQFACDLIARASVTPDDVGCQQMMGAALADVGFTIEPMAFGDVENLWATHGTSGPRFVFAGHTDVVPTGPVAEWGSDPFSPTFKDNLLYGRGAADMKGSLAAMVTAARRFVTAHPKHHGILGFLITSDEEGPAFNGTVRVMETLLARGENIEWCLVGEPSSSSVLGDTVRNGRRGSLNGSLTVKGVQGHVAYADQVVNPIHMVSRALADLVDRQWDEGSADFPPTTFQVSNINAGTGATNVVPGSLHALFNFRYSTALTHEGLIATVEEILATHGLDFSVEWNHSGYPFVTSGGPLIEATRAAIEAVVGIQTEFSTSGGTSDGRFIAPTGTQVVELGPVNATIHKVDECVAYGDLDTLADVYEDLLGRLLPD